MFHIIHNLLNILFLLQTRYFVVVLLVRATSATMKRKPSFQLHSDKDLVNTDFDPLSGLSIPNFIDKNNLTMHIDGITPWRGAREKTSIFMQMLIEACSAPGSRIVDLTVGTGINSYQHILYVFSLLKFVLYFFSSNIHHFFKFFLNFVSLRCFTSCVSSIGSPFLGF